MVYLLIVPLLILVRFSLVLIESIAEEIALAEQTVKGFD